MSESVSSSIVFMFIRVLLMNRCTNLPATPLTTIIPTPKPGRFPACKMYSDSHVECSLMALELGLATPCMCLCTFPESDIQKFKSCALGLGGGSLSAYGQWQDCKKHDRNCGGGDVVVVHGRRLRAA